MSQIKNRILEAFDNARRSIKYFYKDYEMFVNLAAYQFVLVFVSKIAEKFANKIIK